MKPPVAVLVACCLLAAACRSTSDEPPVAASPASQTAQGSAADPVASDAEMDAKLAAADKADGAEDKVVAKCLSCGLGMAGSAEHAVHVGSYELHACSTACKERIRTDAAQILKSLEVPPT